MIQAHASMARSLALISLSFVILQAQQPGNPPTPPQSQTGSITGRVSGEGQPLPGATITIQPVASFFQRRIVAADNNGNFRITNLDPQLYSISVSYPGYRSVPRDRDVPAPYYRIGDNVNLDLIRGGVITGTVTDSAGEPVVAIRVRAVRVRDVDGKKITDFLSNFGEQATDDRGIYRIYGLVPGTYVVFAGTTSRNVYDVSPYDDNVPTYAPAATRDNAAEITVHSGDETTADIRYRGEQGHTVSGKVLPTGNQQATVYLSSRGSGPANVMINYQIPESPGFAITGVPDGDYNITAQTSFGGGSGTFKSAVSAPVRVSVKGADVTGLELIPKPLGSIAGRVSLVASTSPDCQGKRKPLFNEIAVDTKRDTAKDETNDMPFMRFFSAVASLNNDGAFELQYLRGGQYVLDPRFFARYWYLQSLMVPQANAPKSVTVKTKSEVSRSWISLKDGEQLSGLKVILAEGAASIRGKLNPGDGTRVPDNVNVYLVPSEREKADDVLRYFASKVEPDGAFAFNNLPPGRYWALNQPALNDELSVAKFRFPSSAEARSKIRRAAEQLAKEISLKPCQNVTDLQLGPK
ncbi:MAG TPA: carboxypeptidase-like regulatory domain-containing protein [Pyrinomonadaceae bacterium]|nr:carboxypeptidase-like regulatory domain-containing protein [Pyrinomonadaceae bacterium]